MNDRDTKFQGFAKLLLAELMDDMLDEYGFVERSHYEQGELASCEEIIAQRAYDLIVHSVGETIGTSDISHVPDLTKWPE